MISKDRLIIWLEEIDKKLHKKIIIVAVGGTAMTLLGLKSSTIYVDFCLRGEDKERFEKAMKKEFKVDIFVDGYIFSEQLPEDYEEIAKEILELTYIKVKALHPIDIIITKTARLNARDEEDIAAVVKYVDKKELVKRFAEVAKTYAGREEDYQYNFEVVLRRFFDKDK